MKLKPDFVKRYTKFINLQPEKKKEQDQINKIRSEKGEVTTDTTEIQRMIEITTGNYMPIKWTTWKKWINSQKGITFQD